MEEYKVEVFDNGDKRWYQNGKLHRLDGPAIEYANGDYKVWYRNDNYHRLDGPAIEYANGDKYWCRNGKLHRDDGPAIEYANGIKRWYIDDNNLTEEEFNDRDKAEVVEVTLEDIAKAMNVDVDKLRIKEL